MNHIQDCVASLYFNGELFLKAIIVNLWLGSIKRFTHLFLRIFVNIYNELRRLVGHQLQTIRACNNPVVTRVGIILQKAPCSRGSSLELLPPVLSILANHMSSKENLHLTTLLNVGFWPLPHGILLQRIKENLASSHSF